MMKRAVGYIRVSTEEQSREGISLDMQTAKIRIYADLNDLNLTEIIQDAGISGKTIKARPGIQAVLDMVRAEKTDAVIVYKLDRLARNTIETLEMAKLMDKAGCALHSICEKLDTQSALGRFFFTLTASLAEMERGIISERTAAALAQKKANGMKTGGSRPYGYQAAADGKLIPDPHEQVIISRIRAFRTNGSSLNQIKQELEREGIKPRMGARWHINQIVRILKAA
ncbi:MAG TPA: recombinase family protein [Desulfomonilaceae bacterium]|nr:recombinase family protein [Desulfomonilaceae bacterium]